MAFKELHFSWALSKRGNSMSELMAYSEFKQVFNKQDKEDWTLWNVLGTEITAKGL